MDGTETPRARYLKRWAALQSERSTWIEHWRELSEFILPRRARFASTDTNRGSKRNDKIINSAATIAARVLESGMMAGISSPSRPWFRLGTPIPGLAERENVRGWLHDVEEIIREVFAKSDLYNALTLVYGNLGVFGTAPLIVEEDQEHVIQAYVLVPGRYALACDAKGDVDTCYRDVRLTVGQVMEKFQEDQARLSPTVKEAYRQGRLDNPVDLLHIIEPNRSKDGSRADYRGKPFKSCWLEMTGQVEGNGLLRESGYDENPLIAPRWSVTGEDVYGTSPAMDALGDIKALQLLEKRKLSLVDKLANPPMKGPSTLRNQRTSLLPGDVTYVDPVSGGSSFEPAMVVDPRGIQLVDAVILQHVERINQALYSDLWRMLSTSDRRQITAREVEEQHEEKMLQLGPVLERLNSELFERLIDRAFGILWRRGEIPPPPDELRGVGIRVDFISIMAQAQKLLGISAIDRLTSTVSALATVRPEVLDKLNVDEIVDEYASMLGVKPDLVNSDEEVEKIRAARAQQQQAMAAQQMTGTVAQGAKILSETDTSSDNALTRLMNNLGGVAGAAA